MENRWKLNRETGSMPYYNKPYNPCLIDIDKKDGKQIYNIQLRSEIIRQGLTNLTYAKHIANKYDNQN